MLKCFTINIKNSRCSQWESKLFAILSFSLFATPLFYFKPHPFPVPFDPNTSTLTQVSIWFFLVTNQNRKSVKLRAHQMRKKWEVTSQYTSAPDLHQWVNACIKSHIHIFTALIISNVLWLAAHFLRSLNRPERWRWRTLCLMIQLYLIRGMQNEFWALYSARTHTHTHRHTSHFSGRCLAISHCMHRNEGFW